MKELLQLWYQYCGVEIKPTEYQVDAAPSVQMDSYRYVLLPFLGEGVVILTLSGEYYYSKFPNRFTYEDMGHYTVKRSEGGYYLSGTHQKFALHPLTEDVLKEELNPIPIERRKERDRVMQRYENSEPFTIPALGKLGIGMF